MVDILYISVNEVSLSRDDESLCFLSQLYDFKIDQTRTTTYFTLHIVKKDAYWVLANTSGRQYWLVNIALVIDVSKKKQPPLSGPWVTGVTYLPYL